MFLLLRLRSIKFDLFRKRGGEEDGDGKVIALLARGAKGDTEGAGKAAESGGTPLERGLTQIKLDDGSFESESFVGGTKVAFEMVVEAFAKGDTKNLRPLLSNDVYEDFSGAIKSRADNNETLENSLVGISEAEIIEATHRCLHRTPRSRLGRGMLLPRARLPTPPRRAPNRPSP